MPGSASRHRSSATSSGCRGLGSRAPPRRSGAAAAADAARAGRHGRAQRGQRVRALPQRSVARGRVSSGRSRRGRARGVLGGRRPRLGGDARGAGPGRRAEGSAERRGAHWELVVRAKGGSPPRGRGRARLVTPPRRPQTRHKRASRRCGSGRGKACLRPCRRCIGSIKPV